MEKHIKALAVVFIAAIAVGAALAWACAPDSDGAASKGTHLKLTPEWVTASSGTIDDRYGDPLCNIRVEMTQMANGNVTCCVYVKGLYDSWSDTYLQMKTYNDPDDPSSTSFLYETSQMKYYTYDRPYDYQFSGTTTYKEASVFKADLYLVASSTSETPYTGTTTLTFICNLPATTMYDYVTEISYDINYGTNAPATSQDTRSSESVLGTIEMAVSESTDISREGYVFKGWSKSLDGSNLILPGETVTVNAGESTTLYAIWKEETVTICLMDGDSEYLNLVVKKGSVPSLPSLSDRSESTFVGWYKDAELKEKWDTSSPVTKDIVLYAGWQPDFYFTTDPVADCKVTKTSYQTYIFDATVSKDFATSAKSVSWTVVKDGETVHESTGPYMTYQFLEDGEYDVTVMLVNSYGAESEHTEHVTIDTSERPGPTAGLIVMIVMAVLVVAVVARMLL